MDGGQGQGGWTRVRRQLGESLKTAIEAEGEPQREPAQEAQALNSFIGEGAEFEGTLRLRGTFRIDTEFKGTIESETLIVGPSAGIEANIHAREVVIGGAVVGDVIASRQLTLRAGGKLTGDVQTPCLEVEKGAYLNGRTEMVRPEARAAAEASKARAEAKPKPAKGAPAATPAAR